MRRATTPTHVFKISRDNFTIGDVVEAKLTYSQGGKNVVEKGLRELSTNYFDNAFIYALTQEEANKFAPGRALVQMRAKTNDGTVYASQMVYVNVEPVLDSEVM